MKKKSTICLKIILSLTIIVSIFMQSATGVFAEINITSAESEECYGELCSDIDCSDCLCSDCEQIATCNDLSCVDCYSLESSSDQKSSLIYIENISNDEIELLGYNDATCTADGCVNGIISTEYSYTCATCSGSTTVTTTTIKDCTTCSGLGYSVTYVSDSFGRKLATVTGCSKCGGSNTYTTSGSTSALALQNALVGLGANIGSGVISTTTTSSCPDCDDGKNYIISTSNCATCGGDGLINTAEINITSDIQSITIDEGDNVTLCVEAESLYTEEEKSTSDFTYTWYQNGTIINGEQSNTLTIGADEEIGTYGIYAIVSAEGFESVQSSLAVVTVVAAILDFYVYADIEDVTISEGDRITFSVGAELLYSDGTTSLDGITYQWYQNNVAISGATIGYLTVGDALSSGSYDYYCEILYDGIDSIYSSTAVLTVEAVPTSVWLENDIVSTSVVEGNNTLLSITAKSEYSDGSITSSGITYQWYMDGVQISGATGDTLSIGSNLSIGNYLVYVEATCGDYSVRSSVVELEVTSRKYIEISYSFSDSTFLEYITTNLYVVANAKDTLGNSYEGITYQWYIDGEELSGETAAAYAFKSELRTELNSNNEEEKISPSSYLVQVKLSCSGCEDVWVTATITVEVNDGTLTVCNTCYGATVITCTYCLGSGVEECAYCSSTGVVYVGYANYYNQTCSVCEDGYVDCYYCEGGLMDCPDCGGDYTPSAVGYTNTVQEDEDAWYTEAIKKLFLSVTIYMAGIIDLLINLFKKLVGLEEVNIGDSSSNILLYFLELEAVNNVLMYVIVIAFIMLFLFTGIQLIRAMKISDEKVNASKTFEGFLLAAGNILIVPMLLVVLIFSANVIMGQINTVFESGLVYSQADYDENSEISYGGQMLLLLTETEYDKAKVLDMTVDGQHWSEVAEALYNDESYEDKKTVDLFFPNGQISSSATFGENSIIFTNGESFPNYAYMDIDNWTESGSSFWSTSSIDYGIYYIPTSRLQVFIAFAGCIAMLFALIMCSFTFVKRIFDVMLLYIGSPLMISTMPLDDGTRFKQWRDMLISKVLSAYAIVLTVNLYFMIVPTIIINPGVIFDEESAIANGIIQLIFVVGGAFALHSSNAVFGQLLGTGNMEQQQNMGTQMMMMNMVRLGAGVGIGTVALAGKTVFSGAKHSVGTATGGISGAIKGSSNGVGGIIKGFASGSAGYIGSSVSSSKMGQSMQTWANKTQSGSSSLPTNNTTNV